MFGSTCALGICSGTHPACGWRHPHHRCRYAGPRRRLEARGLGWDALEKGMVWFVLHRRHAHSGFHAPLAGSWVGAQNICRSANPVHAVGSSGRPGQLGQADCNIAAKCGEVLLVFAPRGCWRRCLGGVLGDQRHDGGIELGRAHPTHHPMVAGMWGMVAGIAAPPCFFAQPVWIRWRKCGHWRRDVGLSPVSVTADKQIGQVSSSRVAGGGCWLAMSQVSWCG